MQYLLMLHMDEGGWDQLTPEQQAQGQAAYAAFTGQMREAGKLVASGRLMPSEAARTVRTKGGKTVPMDGPFAETKEQIAGFYLLDVADLDEAMELAARCPASGHGVVEVRAIRG